MIGHCSNSYCTENFATENSPTQVKFSMKGVNKGQFKNPMTHYEHILTTKQNFWHVTKVSEPKTRVWLPINSVRML